MSDFIQNCIFYHIYPLGLSGAPFKNDFTCSAGNFFEKFSTELENLKKLGINALYIGPVFESTSHGYDTVDYYYIDRRLGNNEKFSNFCKKAHEMGFKIVLDAVFNHTGRDFFAFKDIQKNGWNSKYKDWYKNLNFDRRSPFGDCFDYEGWAGCKDLVKLNADNPEVENHIFSAVEKWIKEFDIDGLRLDAADVLSLNFLHHLSDFTKKLKSDFWLMGEVVHGNYNNWIDTGKIDSVTNYEVYKGLWSSFNSQNMFEIAYSLKRQFGENGIYKNKLLYSFADNHDVDRVASILTKQENLWPLYGLLFTIPGIPSIYYGSEYGIRGKRNKDGDRELRPSILPFNTTPNFAKPCCNSDELFKHIKKLSEIRKNSNALKKGSYKELSVENKAFAFEREFYGERYVICVNADNSPYSLKLNSCLEGVWEDLLGGGFVENQNQVFINPSYLKILRKVS